MKQSRRRRHLRPRPSRSQINRQVSHMRSLLNLFRAELRRAVGQRFKRVDLDLFKQEIKEHITHFLFEQTQRSPIVIPVVNVIGGKVEAQTVHADVHQNYLWKMLACQFYTLHTVAGS